MADQPAPIPLHQPFKNIGEDINPRKIGDEVNPFPVAYDMVSESTPKSAAGAVNTSTANTPAANTPTATTPAAESNVSSRPGGALNNAVNAVNNSAAHTPAAEPNVSRPGGAPVRTYMNEKIVPYLLEGMKTVTKEQPANPLRALGEFLIQKSNEVEGGAATGTNKSPE